MGQRSQRHLREFDGRDSSGRPGPAPANVISPSAWASPVSGDTVTPAVINLNGDFTVSQLIRVRVNTDIGGVAHVLRSAPDNTAAQTALELANVISLDPNQTGTAVGSTVEVLASGAAATVDLSQLELIANVPDPFVMTIIKDTADYNSPIQIELEGAFLRSDILRIDCTSDVLGLLTVDDIANGTLPGTLDGRQYFTKFISSSASNPNGIAGWDWRMNDTVLEIWPTETSTTLTLDLVEFNAVQQYP